jgi:hypothetical protein
MLLNACSPLRIERWGLRLQPYKLTITYQPGSDNPADFMSRHPSVKTIKSCEQSIAEHYVKFAMSQAIPRANHFQVGTLLST